MLLLEARRLGCDDLSSLGSTASAQYDRSKSVSSRCPLSCSRMFSGFRSLQHTSVPLAPGAAPRHHTRLTPAFVRSADTVMHW
jgi:hypothetical protein